MQMANHERVGRLHNAANKVAMEAYLQGILKERETVTVTSAGQCPLKPIQYYLKNITIF
jgi:formate dehydrogenase assembly factor FdhD